ncbi:MAG: hypothetical protein HQK57_04665 [Deltaproteobacteria bacterium]|nr:hypothetical protein [Deltaproteobacteria bacterium]
MLNQDAALPRMDQRLQEIADKVASQLQARKVRDTLRTEIKRAGLEIEYIKDKLDLIRMRRTETQQAIADLKPRLSLIQQDISTLEEKKQWAEKEYLRLQYLEKDLETKLEVLPQVRSEVIKRRQEVRKATAEFASRKTDLQDMLVRKSGLEEEISSLKDRHRHLSDKINMMRTVRDMVSGRKPDNMSESEFEHIKPLLNTSVGEYSHDVTAQVTHLEQSIGHLKSKLDHSLTETEHLLGDKEQRVKTVAELKSGVAPGITPPIILSEMKELESQKKAAADKLKTISGQIAQLDNQTKAVDTELGQARETETGSRGELTRLTAIKHDLGQAANMEQEIIRLNREIRRLEIEAEAGQAVCGLIRQVEQEMKTVDQELLSAVEQEKEMYEQLLGELEKPLTA